MTHTIRFEYVQRDDAGARVAYQQVKLDALVRLDERAIFAELRRRGFNGVRSPQVVVTPTDANEVQRDLDALLAQVRS